MKFLSLFFLFEALFLPAFAGKSELKVQELSTVRLKDPIRLGFLVQGEISDLELSQKLYNLVVFPALETEEIREFESQKLALILRQKLSFSELQQVTLNIPEKFRIRSQRNFIYLADIRKQIIEQTQSFCRDCIVVFDDLRVPNISGPEEILGTKIDVSGIKAAGSFILPMVIETSKGKNSVWVTGKISTLKKVSVAKKLLKQGDRVTEADIEERIVNLNYIKDGTPTLEEIHEKVLNRSIQLGQPIFYGDLKKESSLKRGQSIKILIVTEALEITLQGTVEEAGNLGDTIKVKSSETQKFLFGKIIENETVRVQ